MSADQALASVPPNLIAEKIVSKAPFCQSVSAVATRQNNLIFHPLTRFWWPAFQSHFPVKQPDGIAKVDELVKFG